MRILYYDMTELWGHRGKVEPGNEKTGASEVRGMQEKPHFNLKT